jgi:predicted transcriptional regulator
MTSESGRLPEEALGDVAFLARSVNRVRVLDLLAREAHPPRELSDRTGTSRSTLRRILSEFEERDWAERRPDGAYTATATGALVVEELTPFVESMETIRRLGGAVGWLPLDTLSLEEFRDATVIRPEANDPLAPASYLTERLDGTSEFRCLVRLAPPVGFEIRMRDAVADGRLTTEHVITRGELDYILDQSERPARWAEYVSGGANLYCYDGEIPCNVFVFDETVVLGKTGQPFIGTDHEAVRRWAVAEIESYRAEAERLRSDVFLNDDSMVS